MTILKIKKAKIKSLECITNDEKLVTCNHLWIASIIDGEYIPYYCEIKQKQVMFPGGTRKCKHFE